MIPVACDAFPVACNAIPVAHNAIRVSHKSGNLHEWAVLYRDLDNSELSRLCRLGAGLLMQVLRLRGCDANLRITVESL